MHYRDIFSTLFALKSITSFEVFRFFFVFLPHRESVVHDKVSTLFGNLTLFSEMRFKKKFFLVKLLGWSLLCLGFLFFPTVM